MHDSIAAVLYAKLQNDWKIETKLMEERDFARFDKFRTCVVPAGGLLFDKYILNELALKIDIEKMYLYR